jgi:hypothetical protein
MILFISVKSVIGLRNTQLSDEELIMSEEQCASNDIVPRMGLGKEMNREKVIELAKEAGFAHSWSEFAGDTLARFATLIEAEVQSNEQPNWKHPKIQALIASDARNKIVIDLIWQLLDNPECELTSIDMEYWDLIHETLKNKLSQTALDANRCEEGGL